jgi:hypothetical protein
MPRAFVAAVFATLFVSAWTSAQPEPTSERPSKVAPERPAGGVFVAVGYGGFRGWSLDGTKWNAERWSDKNQDDPNIIFALTYRDGVFLASGGGVGKGFVLRSVDGKKWDEVVREKWRIAQVTTTGDRFLAAATDTFLLSKDGVTWTKGGSSRPVSATVKGSGYYRRHAVGSDGTVVFAGDYAIPDGKPRIGWTGVTRKGETPLDVTTWPADVRGLAFGGGRFVACTHTGQVLMSMDGAKWKDVLQTGDKHHDDAVRFDAGRFWLRGEKSSRASADGETWEAQKMTRLPRATSPDGVAVDCGWGGIDVSVDGKTWKRASVPIDATGVCSVVWGVPQANGKAQLPGPPERP